MIVITPGIVLSRKPCGEYDRLAVIYTRALGKVSARFIGVDRPKGKLKALAEPLVHAEYRLYARPGTGRVTVTGGRIVDSFPEVRGHWAALMHGLEMCEHLMQIVPDSSPNPRKFDLMIEHLQALEAGAGPWLPLAFGLRLLELAGLGLSRVKMESHDQEIWDLLHHEEVFRLRNLAPDTGRLGRFRTFLEDVVERHAERPLRTKAFRESLSACR